MPHLKQGQNAILIDLHIDKTSPLEASQPAVSRPQFANSYIYSQPKLGIYDYKVSLVSDTTGRYEALLTLDIVVSNTHNYPEPMTVGYDIYLPDGKVVDYNLKEVEVAGNSLQTVHFEGPVGYGVSQLPWSAESPKPFRLTMYSRNGKVPVEYVPVYFGFGQTEYRDGKIWRNGTAVNINSTRFNALSDKTATSTQMKDFKSQGINTIMVDYPQPYWFYDLCDELGFYVFDQANISVSRGKDDRSVGGTPSNDPEQLDEYLTRVKRMYSRNKNRQCVVGWSLGGNSGNGYNMYKAYEWLKAQGDGRPIIYVGADGEWNSDDVQ